MEKIPKKNLYLIARISKIGNGIKFYGDFFMAELDRVKKCSGMS